MKEVAPYLLLIASIAIILVAYLYSRRSTRPAESEPIPASVVREVAAQCELFEAEALQYQLYMSTRGGDPGVAERLKEAHGFLKSRPTLRFDELSTLDYAYIDDALVRELEARSIASDGAHDLASHFEAMVLAQKETEAAAMVELEADT